MATVDKSRFQALGGPARRYLDLKSGEEISRREAIKRSTGKTPEALAAARAAREPRPGLEKLKKTLERLTRRGFKASDIGQRSRTHEKPVGRAARQLKLGETASHEVLSPRAVNDILRGKVSISERRAAQALRALEKNEFNYGATVISRDGSLSRVTLVDDKSVLQYFRYFNALKGLSEGDDSQFDRLKSRDFEIRIVGPSGKVETYRLNDNKAQLQRELKRVPLKEFELPDPETRRYIK